MKEICFRMLEESVGDGVEFSDAVADVMMRDICLNEIMSQTDADDDSKWRVLMSIMLSCWENRALDRAFTHFEFDKLVDSLYSPLAGSFNRSPTSHSEENKTVALSTRLSVCAIMKRIVVFVSPLPNMSLNYHLGNMFAQVDQVSSLCSSMSLSLGSQHVNEHSLTLSATAEREVATVLPQQVPLIRASFRRECHPGLFDGQVGADSITGVVSISRIENEINETLLSRVLHLHKALSSDFEELSGISRKFAERRRLVSDAGTTQAAKASVPSSSIRVAIVLEGLDLRLASSRAPTAIKFSLGAFRLSLKLASAMLQELEPGADTLNDGASRLARILSVSARMRRLRCVVEARDRRVVCEASTNLGMSVKFVLDGSSIDSKLKINDSLVCLIWNATTCSCQPSNNLGMFSSNR